VPSEQKLLIRTCFIQDLQYADNPELGLMIDALYEIPLLRLKERHFLHFEQVISSQVMKEAVNLFIDDTINKGQAPFSSPKEGRKLVKEAFKWVLASEKVLFAPLMSRNHGQSIEGYLYVNEKYAVRSTHESAMCTLILIQLYEDSLRSA
jgi:hypothetical protein